LAGFVVLLCVGGAAVLGDIHAGGLHLGASLEEQNYMYRCTEATQTGLRPMHSHRNNHILKIEGEHD